MFDQDSSLPHCREPGWTDDDFAADAVARGAVAILTDDAEALDSLTRRAARTAIITDPNPHRRLALTAAHFHGRSRKRSSP